MRQQSGDASLLRRLNSAAILRILRAAAEVTLTELARAAKVSRPTAEAIVEELLAEGWAEECEEELGDRQRGRPARRYRFRADAGHVVGVGIGGSTIRAMISDLSGNVVGSRSAGVPYEVDAQERMAAVVRLVEECAGGLGLTSADLAAVGVGTTGVVDGEGRVVKSVRLRDWTGLDLRAELGKAIPAPLLVENDMRLAVLAEHWRGVAQECRDVVYLFTGNRLALGLLIDGVPYRGAHAASGELGEQPNGNWSVFGSVISYAMAAEPGELRAPSDMAEFAFERARAGERDAAAAVEQFALRLGESLVTVVNPLDPEMVVVGGALARGRELLVDPIQAYLNRVCLYPPKVVASELGRESIVVGAVRLALNHADRTLFFVEA
ncbi:ROK family transcriptional regulator [Nonomuraea typhae]|uniref:ROK family transcriptional regulator n=1 Tax=Nonomuraea typhae TaxID=2603600 RepID=UPI0012FC6D33|nr:ROK family transcriptional regulator [Nonomuraea typhae]